MTTRQVLQLGSGTLAITLLSLWSCSPTAQADPDAQEGVEGEVASDEHLEDEGIVVLTEAAFSGSGIVVADVVTRLVEDAVGDGAVPGQVDFDPARVALVSPRTSGRIEVLTAVEGDEVRLGEVVAQVLSSEFLTAQNDLLQATRRVRLMAGTDDAPGVTALAEAAQRRLRLLGAEASLIERLVSGEPPLDLLPIAAPFDGIIVKAHTLAGAAVEPGSPIYTLADLSEVTVVADVPERSLSSLRIGQTAEIVLVAYPGERIRGTVERIREELDATTRTAKAIIRVPNPRRILRPGMFASVRLRGGPASPRMSRLIIPTGAVVTDGSERYVFVEVGPRTFERRAVETELLGADELVVLSGLMPDERVVTEGGFTLKAELEKDEFGDEN